MAFSTRRWLEVPALTVGRVDEFVGRREVGDAEGWAVPVEFLPVEAEGEAAEEGDFGKGAAVIEIGAGGRAPLAGVDPVAIVAFGAGDGLRRAFVCLHFFLGEEAAAGGAVGTVHDFALVADDDGAYTGDLAVGFEIGGAGQFAGAVVPGYLDGGALAASGEPVFDDGTGGVGFGADGGIIIFAGVGENADGAT